MAVGSILLSLLLVAVLLFTEADSKPISNITVIGAVFCDACSDNAFSKPSYFLQGVKVRVECKFKRNSSSREEVSIEVDRTTDRFGIYRLDFPPVDGFECREGRELESSCRASLGGSPSPLCSSPGLGTSTEHVALKFRDPTLCVFNLNALNYRPAKRDPAACRARAAPPLAPSAAAALNASLFLWPPFLFPFPSPPSLPFPFPPIPFFTPPSGFPFPFPPWFPFPGTPSSAFPFPSWSPLPPLNPIPPELAPPPPPPAWFPFPPFPPLFPAPRLPSPPPPSFSWTDPRTWFPFYPPSSPGDQKP